MDLKNTEQKVDILISKMANPALLKTLSNLYNMKKEKGILSFGESNVADTQKTNLRSFNETNECLKILSFSDIKSCVSENSDAQGFKEKRFNSVAKTYNNSKSEFFPSTCNQLKDNISTAENVSKFTNLKPEIENVSSSDSDVCVLDELPKRKRQKCKSKTSKKFSFEPTPNSSTVHFTDSENDDCSFQLAHKTWTGSRKKMVKVNGRKRTPSKDINKERHCRNTSSENRNNELEVNADIIIINSSDVTVTEEFNTKHNDSNVSRDVAVTEFNMKHNDSKVSGDIDSDVEVTKEFNTKHNDSKVSSNVAVTEFNMKHNDSKVSSDIDSDVEVTEEFNMKHNDSKVSSAVAVTEEFSTEHNDSKVSSDVAVTEEFNMKRNDLKVSDVAVTKKLNIKHNSEVNSDIDSDVAVIEEFSSKHNDSKVISDIDSDVSVTEEFNTKHNGSKVSTSGYAACSNTLSKKICKFGSKQNKLYSVPLLKINSSEQNHHLVLDQTIYTISSDSSEESDQNDANVEIFKCNALPTSIKVSEALESTYGKKARNNFKSKEIYNVVKNNSLMKDSYLYSSVDREKSQGNTDRNFNSTRINKSQFNTGNSTLNFNEIRKGYDEILNQLRSVANCHKILNKLSIANPGLISLKSVVPDSNLQCKDFEFVPEPVNFKIPRLHQCEVVCQVSKEEELKMIQEGIFIRYGSFTAHEDEILKENFLEFVKQYGITNPSCLLGIDSDLRKDRDLLQFIRTKHFYLRLGRNLNDRTLSSIYRRAKKLLS